MDYKKLEILLQKEDLEQKDLWKFFGVETKELMEKLIEDNLQSLKIKPDDAFVYIAPKNIYESSQNKDYNIFYEKLILTSFFLRGFAQYEDVIIQGFIAAVGMMSMIFIAETQLKDNEYFIFFINAFKEYKHDKYFREQTDRVLNMFENMAEEFEKIDLEELKNTLKSVKEIV